MLVHVFVVAILLAVGVRLAFKGRTSYRNGRVGISIFLSQSIHRPKQPGAYWAAMALHTFLVLAFFTFAAVLIFKWVPTSN